MNTDPCQNINCQWYDSCLLREQGGQIYTPKWITKLARGEVEQKAKSLFNVKKIEGFSIGELSIKTPTERSIEAILSTQWLKISIDGLLVHFDTLGGTDIGSKIISNFIQGMKETMPVIAHVRTACSAGVDLISNFGIVFADYDALIGGYGVLLTFCDGCNPQCIRSVQSPEKPLHEIKSAPNYFIPTYEIEERQRGLDDSYERGLVAISARRGVPADVLREPLNGWIFGAKAAMYYGLVDEIGSKESARARLVEKIRAEKEKK